MATLLGALVGILVDRTVRSLSSIKREEPAKGQQVDFTLPADDLELQIPGSSNPNERTSVVPQAQGASTDAPEPFQPLDFKKTARQVKNTMKE